MVRFRGVACLGDPRERRDVKLLATSARVDPGRDEGGLGRRRRSGPGREGSAQRLAALQRQAEVKQRELALTEDISARRTREFDQGVLSAMDANRAKLDVEKLGGELEVIRAAIVDARNTMARIAFEMASRTATYAETERAIGEELTTYKYVIRGTGQVRG